MKRPKSDWIRHPKLWRKENIHYKPQLGKTQVNIYCDIHTWKPHSECLLEDEEVWGQTSYSNHLEKIDRQFFFFFVKPSKFLKTENIHFFSFFSYNETYEWFTVAHRWKRQRRQRVCCAKSRRLEWRKQQNIKAFIRDKCNCQQISLSSLRSEALKTINTSIRFCLMKKDSYLSY